METYTSGTWTVRAGEEEAFIDDWRAFAETASSIAGSGTLRLTRELGDPSRFLSFAAWESADAAREWTESDAFREQLERVKAHTTDFASRLLELVVAVEAGAYSPTAM
jgi:heme-degrading monooxygenase HmoA